MAYDPRSAALADGLFTQRFGKTVLVVTDDTARDALDPAVTPVAITASDDLLNIYDADISAWTKVGKETVVTVPAVADLTDIANPEEIKLAIVDATSEIYRYNGSEWVLCAGGGGAGSGVQTVATVGDLALVSDPENNPIAFVFSENAFYSYIDGEWGKTVGSESTKEVVGGGSWSLVKKIEKVSEITAEAFTLEKGRYRMLVSLRTPCTGTNLCLRVNDDAGANYRTRTSFISSTGDVDGQITVDTGIAVPAPNWSAHLCDAVIDMVISDDGVTFSAHRVTPGSGAQSWSTTGWSGDPSTLSIVSTIAIDATFNLYRWEDIRATELHTYELVKEIVFNNEIVDASLPWNKDDYDIRIVVEREYVNDKLCMRINGDAGNNYTRAVHYGGTSHGVAVYTESELNIATHGAVYAELAGSLVPGAVRAFHDTASKFDSTSQTWRYTGSSFWNNAVDKVSSLQFFSAVATTGRIRVYKLAKTHLLDTAINKVPSEIDLLGIPVWDGKLAMTLDKKQLYVYDTNTSSWNIMVGGSSGAPVGTVSWFCGQDAPRNYEIADGGLLLKSDYPELFEVIGTTYGENGDYFNKPDLRGEFVRGLDLGRGVDAGRVLGSTQMDELKQHRHSHNDVADIDYNSTGSNSAYKRVRRLNGNTGYTGGNETRPRNIALLPCIKVYPDPTPVASGGLPVMSVASSYEIDRPLYIVADASTGPMVLTITHDGEIGDEIVILDATRVFGTEGHECTLSPGTVLVEGGSENIDLNVEGKEYKFKFVGGSVGWRMI